MHKIKLALKLVNTKSQGDRVLINLAEDPNPNIIIEKQLDRILPKNALFLTGFNRIG